MKFFLIENTPYKIKEYDNIGIDRIFIDLEILGKEQRQGHLNTVISKHHRINDIGNAKKIVVNSKILVRCNPINNSSKNEINEIINQGADYIMLPYYKTKNEVEEFLSIVDNRTKTILLLETPEAYVRLYSYVDLNFDELYIGLNDLHLGMNLNFMFELLSGGIVEHIVKQIKFKENIKYGFGGIATLEGGKIPGKNIIKEHYRLGSELCILSRTFINEHGDNYDKLKKNVELLRLEYENSKHLTNEELIYNYNVIKNLTTY